MIRAAKTFPSTTFCLFASEDGHLSEYYDNLFSQLEVCKKYSGAQREISSQ